MAEPITVLVVDDDPHLRDVVRFALAKAGYEVSEASDGREALQHIERVRPSLMVLDINMPEMDGLEVCRVVRQESQLPIIFLSSRDEDVDRIVGLELGGDDYLSKPFSPRELVARVRAVLRRTRSTPEPHESAANSIHVRFLRMDLSEWKVFAHEREVVLTATEFQLLAALARTPGKVFTRDELMVRAYEDIAVSDRTIDSHIRRIRQKFAQVCTDEVVETVHGVGYRVAGS